MEGQILAEFSGLNALRQGAAPTYGAPQDGFGAQSGGKEQFTGSAMSGRMNEQFIDDDPERAQFGVQQLLPAATKTEERERLLRRLEMCAKAREESTKIMSLRFAERDQVKNSNSRERQELKANLTSAKVASEERWGRKLQKSPFAVDLVAEIQRIEEENSVRDTVEQRRQRLMARRNREAHNAIFKRATAEMDELDQLRQEKRMLLENERQLKALRDVEKSNARTAQILQERRKQQLEKQQAQLMQVVNGGGQVV